MKKILLISYKFPPVTGPQSMRWAYFAKYLSEAGYQVEVLTIRPEPGFGTYDASSLEDVPPNIVIHRTYPGPLYSLTYRYLSMKQGWVKKDTQGRTVRSRIRGTIRTLYQKNRSPVSAHSALEY